MFWFSLGILVGVLICELTDHEFFSEEDGDVCVACGKDYHPVGEACGEGRKRYPPSLGGPDK